MNQSPIQLEAVLDSCLTAVLEQGQSVTSCLDHYPTYRAALEPLINVGLRLKAAQSLQPAPEFQQVAETRMKNLIAAYPRNPAAAQRQQSVRLTWRSFFQTRRKLAWGSLLSIVLIFWLLVGSVTVYAAADTLPGDRLYAIKRLTESVQLSLTADVSTSTRLHLTFADRRLQETADLLAAGHLEWVEDSLTAYEEEVETAVTQIQDSSHLLASEQEALTQLLVVHLTRHQIRLVAWEDNVPDDVQTAVRQTLVMAQNRLMMATTLLEPEDLNPVILSTPTPPSPTATAVPSNTAAPTQPPTPSRTATPNIAAPTRPSTITPTSVWQIPSNWPEECPSPPNWPDIWPSNCVIPTGWPTPINGYPPTITSPPSTVTPWPTIPATPTVLIPPGWPDTCPIPPEWPDEWPEDCPIPTGLPPGWPTPPTENGTPAWPTPSPASTSVPSPPEWWPPVDDDNDEPPPWWP